MVATTVVNKHHKVPYDVYIGRPGPWGNPYSLPRGSSDAARHAVIVAFEKDLLNDLAMLRELHQLRGKRLACFCSPKECHGDVLAYWADRPEEVARRITELEES